MPWNDDTQSMKTVESIIINTTLSSSNFLFDVCRTFSIFHALCLDFSFFLLMKTTVYWVQINDELKK